MKINITTNEVLASIDLTNFGTAGQLHWANDVVVDAQGNAYITDSLGKLNCSTARTCDALATAAHRVRSC